jgi:hypothetical protein
MNVSLYQRFAHTLNLTYTIISGVRISFSRHSPNWRVVQQFHSPEKKMAKNIERVSEREKKNSPDWRVGLYFLHFYSPILISTRIWRVGEWLSAPLIILFWFEFLWVHSLRRNTLKRWVLHYFDLNFSGYILLGVTPLRDEYYIILIWISLGTFS